MSLAYPLEAKFKLFSIGQTVLIRDSQQKLVCCVKQKAFKLKEDITVFSDEAQKSPMFSIKADKIIDWSASYTVREPDGDEVCVVRRKGARSIWKATYEIHMGGKHAYTITEKNPWSKVFDAMVSEVPILGMFTGYMFHPVYAAHAGGEDGPEAMQAKKMNAFLEGKFGITAGPALKAEDEIPLLMGFFMVLLLERLRG